MILRLGIGPARSRHVRHLGPRFFSPLARESLAGVCVAGLQTTPMGRILGILLCLTASFGCDDGSSLATPPGVLLDVGPELLGSSAPASAEGGRAPTERTARCRVQDPGEAPLFSLDVLGRSQGPQLIGVRVSIPASECVVEARLGEAQPPDPVGGVPAVAHVVVNYRCRRYRGQGVIEVPAGAPPTSHATQFRCSGISGTR